jgi:hypothetical protein
MKTITLFIAFILGTLWLKSQSLSSSMLSFAIADANTTSHEAAGNDYTNAFWKKKRAKVFYPKDSLESRYLLKKIQSQKAYLQRQQLTEREYAVFKQTLLAQSFSLGKPNGSVYTALFQKKDITVIATAKTHAEKETFYDIAIEKRALPRIKDVQFAEDLLAYDSHQHLELACGPQNVKKDVFYNADGTTVNCSVIYPASSREVVFLWYDTTNLRQLAYIRVGGNMHTTGAMRYNNVLSQNQWVSRQGLYATMTLDQLHHRNGNTLNFYGWGGGARGNLYGDNKGNIDFSQLDLAFGCLNCNDDAYYGKRQLASDRAIEDGRRIFIATMIFYPPTKGDE